MFRTHLVFGLLIGLLTFKFFSVNPILFIVVTTISSSFPDIDIKGSWISKKLKLFSWFFYTFFRHRGFFHSVFPSLIVFLIFYYYNLSFIGYAFVIGYLSHLLADGLTKSGVRILHPFFKFKVKGFFRTGGLLENLFFYFILVVIVITFFKTYFNVVLQNIF